MEINEAQLAAIVAAAVQQALAAHKPARGRPPAAPVAKEVSPMYQARLDDWAQQREQRAQALQRARVYRALAAVASDRARVTARRSTSKECSEDEKFYWMVMTDAAKDAATRLRMADPTRLDLAVPDAWTDIVRGKYRVSLCDAARRAGVDSTGQWWV